MRNVIHFLRTTPTLFAHSLVFFLLCLASAAHAQYPSSPSTYRQPRSSGTTNTSTYGNSGSYDVTPDSRQTSGYTRQNGTVVSPYNSSVPDNTNLNNYSTQGNTNPFTGTTGTRARDYTPEATNYGQGHTIQTGPRGGQYYTNDQGNKVYVPKQKSPF